MDHGAHSRGHLRVVRTIDPKPYDQVLDEYMAGIHRYTPEDPATIDHPRPEMFYSEIDVEEARRLHFHIVASAALTVMVIVWFVVWVTW